MAFRVGDTVEGYLIEAVLGEGGMGQVFRVHNMITDRREAMKIVLPRREADEQRPERFLREIRVLASLDHPHIVGLRTALRVGDEVAMIMELVDGVSLADRLRTGVYLTDGIRYISQVLDALGYAHTRGVIHRDVKPPNIMVTNSGVAKLTDFGVAYYSDDRTLTASGAAVGSLYYMSPEQVRGDPVDGRSDIYSAGATLYELVTGKHAIRGESSFAVMNGHLHDKPLPPDEVNPAVPRSVSDAILHALAKRPADRFQAASEFQAALDTALPKTATIVTAQAKVPSSGSLDAGVLKTAKQKLATVIGPIATVMVDRAARTAKTPTDLYRVLAQQIPDARERENFLKSAPQR